MKRKLFLLLAICLFSCGADSDDTGVASSEFAMTAKIDGDVFEANSPWEDNEFSTYNIFTQFPEEDFVLLQGREGGLVGTGREINIWLKRSDLVVGTYVLDENSFDIATSHAIDLTDNTNSYLESTTDGTIVIDEVDTSNKIVKGTFEFTVLGKDEYSENIIFNVTEGVFNYIYE